MISCDFLLAGLVGSVGSLGWFGWFSRKGNGTTKTRAAYHHVARVIILILILILILIRLLKLLSKTTLRLVLAATRERCRSYCVPNWLPLLPESLSSSNNSNNIIIIKFSFYSIKGKMLKVVYTKVHLRKVLLEKRRSEMNLVAS